MLNCYLASGNGIKMETVLREKIADIVLRIDLAFKSEKPEGYRLETGKNSISITSDSPPQGVLTVYSHYDRLFGKRERLHCATWSNRRLPCLCMEIFHAR